MLVVDDDETIRLLSHRILAAYGAAVELADNGRMALQILLRQDFDVVLVDLRMQEMNGIAFIQEARNIWPWLGFIIMTGFMDDMTSEVSSRLGIHHLLEKPVSPEQLCGTVLEEYLERRKALGALGPEFEEHQRQLRMLGHLGETALSANTFVEALQELSDGLGELMSCDVAGLFGFSEGQKIIVFSAQKKVSLEFLNSARGEILKRYEALSGQTVDPAGLRVQLEGVPPGEDGPSVPRHLLAIPLLVNNEVQGILLLASAEARVLGTVDVAFVYQIANVLSSILAAVTRIRQIAAHDSLTGLYNRAYFEEQMERAWQMARRYGHNMAVAIMDIDHFKSINDAHGHPTGDRILAEFAGIIRKVARASDVEARFGGDEFVVLFPEIDIPFAVMLGERIRKAVEDHVFCADTMRLKVTTSLGLSTSRQISTSDPASEMMRLADIALYAVKREGRNKVGLWSPEQCMDSNEKRKSPPEKALDSPKTSTHPAILVVDDDPVIVKIVQTVLEGAGYVTDSAFSSAEAIAIAHRAGGNYDLVITDLEMPVHSGLEVLSAFRQVNGFVMGIVITGHATKDNAVASLREGAFDFIEKPVRPEKLLSVVEKALDLRSLRIENERYRLRLEDMVLQKSATILETLEALKQSHDFTLKTMAGLLDVREHDTGKHSSRVRDLSLVLGRIMKLSEQDLDVLTYGALLHDIGKIAVPDHVLLKPGLLSEEEWMLMKAHPEIGFKILSPNQRLKDVAELVYAHQERYDGTGYPRGLKGEAICLGARIFAVIDAYDAMRSNRPYRRSMSAVAAAKELKAGSGTQFDPVVVESFLLHQGEIEAVGAWGDGGSVSS